MRYVIDGLREGTRIWTPYQIVAVDPHGAEMGTAAVAYLEKLGYGPRLVDVEPHRRELTPAQAHIEVAGQIAEQAAIDAQSVTVPIRTKRPYNRRVPIGGEPVSGNDL